MSEQWVFVSDTGNRGFSLPCESASKMQYTWENSSTIFKELNETERRGKILDAKEKPDYSESLLRMTWQERQRLNEIIGIERKVYRKIQIMDKAFTASSFAISLVSCLSSIKENFIFVIICSIAISINGIIYALVRKGLIDDRIELMNQAIDFTNGISKTKHPLNPSCIKNAES